MAAPKGNIILDFLIYNDIEDSNKPEQRIFDFTSKDTSLVFDQVESRTADIIAGDTFTFTFPAAGVRYLYIKSNTTLGLSLNGGAVISIIPDNADSENGQFFLKGLVTSASLLNGTTGMAQITYFWGN